MGSSPSSPPHASDLSCRTDLLVLLLLREICKQECRRSRSAARCRESTLAANSFPGLGSNSSKDSPPSQAGLPEIGRWLRLSASASPSSSSSAARRLVARTGAAPRRIARPPHLERAPGLPSWLFLQGICSHAHLLCGTGGPSLGPLLTAKVRREYVNFNVAILAITWLN